MKIIKTYKLICFIIIILISNSCVELFDIKTLTFENALVIEATITNEFKLQEINLSRTFRLEDEGPLFETNADVKIEDDSHNIYNFHETSPGKYVSVAAFSAQTNIDYQLLITTKDGKSYSSQPTKLTNITKIDNVYALKEVDDLGVENISIFVDSFDPTGKSKYYRYEYEETYKIVAPKWNASDYIVNSSGSYFYVEKVPKTKEERVCYKAEYSNAILQVETNGLSEDRISKFPVRVLSRDNTIISHRYSIVVKQYVQSLDAYTYYKTLNKLSGSESVFSQSQPGFFNGNVFSVDDTNEKVVGFFELSSVVTSQRIYFNFQDFFSNESLPPYFTECGTFSPDSFSLGGVPSQLVSLLMSGTIKYYGPNPNYPNPLDETEGPYLFVMRECGDCTFFGSNIKPDFWIE
jgi:hypothetical protein